jgi:DNA topoisomerase-3
VTDIPVPERESQSSKAKRKRSDITGTCNRSAGRAAEKADLPSATGLGDCPLCGAEVQEQKKSYSCSGWKRGCKFVIWKKIAGKTIGIRTAKALLRKRETRRLKGFKSKAGKPFDARLKLVDGEVQFDFSL